MPTPAFLRGAAVTAALILFPGCSRGEPAANRLPATGAPTAAEATTATAAAARKLPRLIDLGAKRCIPCKRMAPILADLKSTHADLFVTEFIDVWENPAAGEAYKIRLIPTQIFFDAEGRERFRHEGFLDRGSILAQWQQLGVEVPAHAGTPPPAAQGN
ncbi:MAG: thioredoxin family protein [Lentisphaeria bacterium]|jgi:thioredoxin 1